MSKTVRQQMWDELAPLRACLKGWAFSSVKTRRAQVARAKELVPALPERVQQWALDEIAAVEVHCGADAM